MQKILNKRILRDLKENCFRYLSLGFLIVLGMYIVISLSGAADTVITGVNKKAEENKIEDGQFTLFMPLSDKQEKVIFEKGITLEKMFYIDYRLENTSTLRMFKNRENVNKTSIDYGRLAEQEGEVVLEKRYCEENNISLGDSIDIGGKKFEIVGIGTVPDYDAMFKNISDNSVKSSQFGLAFVTENQYEILQIEKQGTNVEVYNYAYRLNDIMADNEFKDYVRNLDYSIKDIESNYFSSHIKKFSDFDNLIMFISSSDNPRIKASANDRMINKFGGIIAGIITMILFTYVISVFVIHGIEKESSVIGSLYALGAKKKDLIKHYLMLPVIITFIAGICGTILGFSKYGIHIQMKECYNYFSVPVLKSVYPAYLIIYGIVMPPVIAAAVNYFVINRRLSQPALKLIRNEQKQSRISNVDLGNMGFIRRFCIRQMLREVRTCLTVVFGMLISLLVMMLGVDCYVMCNNLETEIKADTKYEYMYSYKYREDKVPDGGEICYMETLSKEIYGYNLDISLLGIRTGNPYFDAEVVSGKDKIIVSTAAAQKYSLQKGDNIILTDKNNNKEYSFKIEGISQYAVGLHMFMDINSMRELFKKSDDYYNIVLSDRKLDVDYSKVYTVTTKEDISKGAEVFVELMMPMIIMLITVSGIIFVIVLYLMMKVMIDRSSFNISLIKIFGYRMQEVRRLYLNGNFYIVIMGGILCTFISKVIIDKVFPYLISNVACGMNLKFSWELYFCIFASIIILYLIINQLLVKHLEKMIPVEVLKNRE